MGTFIDLTGQVFGEWTVIERATGHPRGKTYWKCRCSCGIERDVQGYSLRTGKSQSCGCKQIQSGKRFQQKEYRLKDGTIINSVEIGLANISIGQAQKNGYLVICDRASNTKSKKARVICKCNKCGNYTVINHQDFMDEKVISCGCFQREQSQRRAKEVFPPRDWSSPEYNINPYYEFLEETGETRGGLRLYKIRCRKCGKEFVRGPAELVSDKRSKGLNPCTCWRTESRGALKVRMLLENNNIKYELEKKFDTCLSPTGTPLRFDFYLPDYNILIEYDGIQHFKPAFGEGDKKLKLQQQYDNIKNEWCKDNGIQLVRIPYARYKDFTIQDLIPQEDKK